MLGCGTLQRALCSPACLVSHVVFLSIEWCEHVHFFRERFEDHLLYGQTSKTTSSKAIDDQESKTICSKALDGQQDTISLHTD